MSEKGNQHEPVVHEFMDPGERFVALARAVMRQHGQDPDESIQNGPIEVVLPKNDNGDHFKIMKGYIGTYSGAVFLAYMLERYSSDYSSTIPKNRYLVGIDEDTDKATGVYPFDAHNNPLIGATTRPMRMEAARTALRILGSQSPDLARSLIEQSFDKAYGNAVADYILSDLAREDSSEPINDESAKNAVNAFKVTIEKIGEKVIKESQNLEPKDGYPQPAYHDAVVDAFKNNRKANDRDRYKDLEYIQLVTNAAREIGDKWTGILKGPEPNEPSS